MKERDLKTNKQLEMISERPNPLRLFLSLSSMKSFRARLLRKTLYSMLT